MKRATVDAQAFADAIGADAYCEDAVSSVRAAKKFISQV